MNFEPIRIPPMMTRAELVAWMNEMWPDRPQPITIEMVRYWDREGLLKPHSAFRGRAGRTVRYTSDNVAAFLNDSY